MLFLLLLLVGCNAAFASTLKLADKCRVIIDKEDILQVAILTATKVILLQMEKFNGGDALDPVWAKYMSEMLVKEMLNGSTLKQVLGKHHHRCVEKLPPIGIPQTKIEATENDKKQKVKKTKDDKLEVKKRTQNEKSVIDIFGSRSYLCLIENDVEVCYAYSYTPDTDISLEEPYGGL